MPFIANNYGSVTVDKQVNVDLKPDEPKTGEEQAATSDIRISEGKVTDFIKIISAAYDLHLFSNADGTVCSNKQHVMEVFGEVLNNPSFKNYSTLLNNSKSRTKNYTEIFDKLKQKGQEYELK